MPLQSQTRTTRRGTDALSSRLRQTVDSPSLNSFRPVRRHGKTRFHDRTLPGAPICVLPWAEFPALFRARAGLRSAPLWKGLHCPKFLFLQRRLLRTIHYIVQTFDGNVNNQQLSDIPQHLSQSLTFAANMLRFWAILKRTQSPIVCPDGRCSFLFF